MNGASRVPGATAAPWFAEHIPWLTIGLIALWMPPLLYRIAVDVGLIGSSSSGFPGLLDPSTLLASLQLTLMIAAVPDLRRLRRLGWMLAASAVLVGFIDTAWGFAVDLRLAGVMPAVTNTRRLLGIAATAAAGGILLWIRNDYE